MVIQEPTKETPQPRPDLVPARMLNEFAYCPRVAYLEWVQGGADSVDTVEGRSQHRRVDSPECPDAPLREVLG